MAVPLYDEFDKYSVMKHALRCLHWFQEFAVKVPSDDDANGDKNLTSIQVGIIYNDVWDYTNTSAKELLDKVPDILKTYGYSVTLVYPEIQEYPTKFAIRAKGSITGSAYTNGMYYVNFNDTEYINYPKYLSNAYYLSRSVVWRTGVFLSTSKEAVYSINFTNDNTFQETADAALIPIQEDMYVLVYKKLGLGAVVKGMGSAVIAADVITWTTKQTTIGIYSANPVGD